MMEDEVKGVFNTDENEGSIKYGIGFINCNFIHSKE